MVKRSLEFIDLFAECGGLSLGLENAGSEPVFFSELNDDGVDTYKLNRRGEHSLLDDENSRFFLKDVKDLVLDQGRLGKLKTDLAEEHGLCLRRIPTRLFTVNI